MINIFITRKPTVRKYKDGKTKKGAEALVVDTNEAIFNEGHLMSLKKRDFAHILPNWVFKKNHGSGLEQNSKGSLTTRR